MNAGTVRVPVVIARGTGTAPRRELDVLAVEEPFEIRLAWTEDGAPIERAISVTMRTPGNDEDLACGFLYTEGLIAGRDDVVACEGLGNVARVELAPGVKVRLGGLERNFYVTSSCGVCGKASIDAIRVHRAFPDAPPAIRLSPEVIHVLPDALRKAQSVFEATGGLHAAGLFDLRGTLLAAREDVGRHNAVDKLIGAAVRAGKVPLHDAVLMLSGRASFELLQKASMAGIFVVAAVGAPSSLAVELAESAGITLLGFVRDRRFNVYARADRVVEAADG
jgi:FdhD protein